ncbi:MAG: hypothetical protein IJQ34_08590 [Kiritimatiellae bacterium]|nr:hypothetical protein [Kiritimatiellia bacterium]
MKLRGLLTVISAVLISAAALAAQMASATGKGVALNRNEAIYSALAEAMVQVTGVTLTEAQRIVSSDSSIATYVKGEDSKRTTVFVNDGARYSDINAKGNVKSFSIISDEFNEETGRYTVIVEAEIEKAYEDPAPNSRRRMAIAPFRTKGENFVCRGETIGTADWSLILNDKLNIELAQTRKFNVLERKFDAEINEELARITAKNGATEDYRRLNRKLSTDYLVVGEITFLPEVTPTEHPITKKIIWPTSAPFAEITYRVILAPNGQLKWIDSITIDGAAYQTKATTSEYLSAVAQDAAAQISEQIMANILPFTVEKKLASGMLVIGQGGKSLKAGDILNAYKLGEEIYDSTTGDYIDTLEEPIGSVRIVEVLPKLSYAQVIGGDINAFDVGVRLRRPQVLKEEVEPYIPTPVMTTIPLENGGVIVPFK